MPFLGGGGEKVVDEPLGLCVLNSCVSVQVGASQEERSGSCGICIQRPAGLEPWYCLVLFQSCFTLAGIQGCAGSEMNKALLEDHNRPPRAELLLQHSTQSATTLME